MTYNFSQMKGVVCFSVSTNTSLFHIPLIKRFASKAYEVSLKVCWGKYKIKNSDFLKELQLYRG